MVLVVDKLQPNVPAIGGRWKRVEDMFLSGEVDGRAGLILDPTDKIVFGYAPGADPFVRCGPARLNLGPFVISSRHGMTSASRGARPVA